jgi:L-seryl-tRNA(Ser) seleniumtransferase
LTRNTAGYCSLEYDVSSGRRGRRGGWAEDLLCRSTGAEAAAIVNNCAAAAFLVLTSLACGREVIISRGELVEIGGDFRIPDVLEQSGAELREVGTTNRTKLSDYAKAVNDRTGMLLRVHPSNYRVIGFTERPEAAAIARLAREKGIVFYEDAGSGALIDLSEFGLGEEPVIARSIRDGVDIVTFSGDKLLGGPQAGLIVGRTDLIEKVRRHPLYRALRAGKLVYGALEATLESYARGRAFAEIPVLKMIAADQALLDRRVRAFADRLKPQLAGRAELSVTIVDGNSVIGGGSAPGVQPEATLLAIASKGMSAAEIERRLRAFDPPVIARIEANQVLIDLRTVDASDEDLLSKAIVSVNTGTDAAYTQHAEQS